MDEKDAVQLARDYISLKRTLLSGEEFLMLCKALVRIHDSATPTSDLEAQPGRIPDFEGARQNADYWLAEAKHPDVEHSSAAMFFEQAINAWKNAAYAMADQRDAARSQTADLEALMADGRIEELWQEAMQHIAKGFFKDTFDPAKRNRKNTVPLYFAHLLLAEAIAKAKVGIAPCPKRGSKGSYWAHSSKSEMRKP